MKEQLPNLWTESPMSPPMGRMFRKGILAMYLIVPSFFPGVSWANGQSITMHRQGKLSQILEEFKKQTGYDYILTGELAKKAQSVNVDLNKATIKEALNTIFEGQNLDYLLEGKSIVVIAKKTTTIQQQGVSGMVVDSNGKPLADATIRIKGKANVETSSGSRGEFRIAATKGDILIVSSVGYNIIEQKVEEGNVLIRMTQANHVIDDVVVVGYGTMRRKDLTGSVASVNVEEVKNVPFATIDQALTGKASGVQVVQADGSPGGVAKIRIRGGTSLLGGNDPLYIIDGVQMTIENRYKKGAADIVSPVERQGYDEANNTVEGSFARGLNSLGGLNFNDIESIDILKDASATAIYGSKAANGVIIITTKKGKMNQKPVFDANYYTAVSTPIKEKLLNAEQYTMIMKEAAKNLNDARLKAGMPLSDRANSILNDSGFLGTGNTDWLDLVLRNSLTQNADISVRGGGQASRYYTSLGYNKNNGVIKGTDYNRISGKVNLDNEITSRFRINTNLNYGFTTNNITNGLYTQALSAPPTFDPYNPDGSIRIIAPEDIGAYGYEGFQNPLALLKGVNKSTNASLIGSLMAEFDIRKDLTFRSSFAMNYNSYQQDNYIPSTAGVADPGGMGSSNNGIATQAQSRDINSFYENTLTWNKQFDENNRLTLLGGTSWQLTKSDYFSASGQGFPDDDYLNNLSSAAIPLAPEGNKGQHALLSFYMRANYTLKDKYIFTFTGRTDESSKFPKGSRTGYFPSGGVAWRLSQEKFLKDVSWLDELKLRASMGSTGTQNIADNLFYTLFSPVSYGGKSGLSPTQLGNDKIRWESTLQKDAGVNFSLFKGRLMGEFGYYEKGTTGVLFPTNVATSSGFGTVGAVNIANVRNRGLELALSGDFIRRENFQWSGSLNISGNRSKVLALSSLAVDPNNPEVYKYGNTVLQVGEPLGLLYGKVFDGLLRTQQEVDEYAEQHSFYMFGLMPYLDIGDPRYVLDDAEYRFPKDDIIGHAEPKFYGGYTNTINYKNFGFSFLTTFTKGGDILYLFDVQNQHVATTTNKGIRILDRWTKENPNANRPRLLLGEMNESYSSTSTVYDASFLKLKSITFSYNLPNKLMKRWGINHAMAYLSATNVFTITNYPGADPEVSNDPYSLIGGYSDTAGYPTVRQVSLGIRVGF